MKAIQQDIKSNNLSLNEVIDTIIHTGDVYVWHYQVKSSQVAFNSMCICTPGGACQKKEDM